MWVGTGLSTLEETGAAAREATGIALAGLGGRPSDLAVVFGSPHHAAAADELLEAIHVTASPSKLIGCIAEAVLANEREIEDGPGLSVWLGSFDAPPESFHMRFIRTDSGGAFGGWRFDADPEHADADAAGTEAHQADGAALHLLLCDPYSFPVDTLLRHLNDDVPGAVVVGGMASGAVEPGQTIMFHDRSVVTDGAVGARLAGSVRIRTLVSQGCRPFGGTFVVTKARDNVVLELAGRPPLERLRDAVSALAPPDQELVARGIHLGRAIDEYRSEHGQGDFLIRGVVGVDPDTGAMAVGDRLEVGETVRFHVRDAMTADEELRALLERTVQGLPGPPAGALLFTCNGRGSRMFPTPDHDARLVSMMLGGAPLAGFFCAGELGPVGGKNFLHGFTASLAIFSGSPGSAR